MKKDYHTKAAAAATDQFVMADTVTLAMNELAETVKEGLLALAVGAGLQVMQVMMQDSVNALCGPKGRHDADRTAVRHGQEDGSVTLGGRRVPVRRPGPSADGTAEVAVPAYELFASTELLGGMALARMMAKLSTRRYSAGLEPVGTAIEAGARSTSKSAVSRRFVAATESALADLLAADLSGLDLVALMIDGVHFADHLCVVALGIGIDGTKHPLGVVEGDTENTTVVKDLLAGLRDRGLDTTRPILCVLDGAKALVAGVKAVFDHPVVHRCQLHKVRNVESKLPKALASTVATKIRVAYHDPDALAAEATLQALARSLEKKHPGAAGQPTRRPLRDPHRDPPGRAAHLGSHPSLDQRRRVDDRDLPGPLHQRQTVAGWSDGAALVCRWHARSHQTVPPGQRFLAPARPASRTRSRRQHNRHTQRTMQK